MDARVLGFMRTQTGLPRMEGSHHMREAIHTWTSIPTSTAERPDMSRSGILELRFSDLFKTGGAMRTS